MIGGIAAGIVVFNAEKGRLENNISRLKKQVNYAKWIQNFETQQMDFGSGVWKNHSKK